MKTRGKRNKPSINLQIFISMIALSLIIIALIWTFQMMFTKAIFKTVKERAVDKTATDIIDNAGNSSWESYIAKKTSDHDVSAAVFEYKSVGSIEKIYADEDATITESQGNEEMLSAWFYSAYANDWEFTPVKSSSEIVFVRVFEHTVDTTPSWYMVIVNTEVTPPSGTLLAIRSLLVALSITCLIVSVIVSFFLSRSISLPVSKMSKKAKSLTLYDYDVSFDEKGPREIAELAVALNSATAELKKLSDTQKELIANISHDLRTPLTMISGYSEVMRDFPDERSPENMQIIIDETARLNSLVNDLLTVSKLQSGSQVMNLKAVSITKAVQDTVKRYEKLLEHKEYNIVFESDCEVFVSADETRLLQVVYNLINNAINYTGDDKTVIVRQEVYDDVVRISVIDSGEGISEENLPLIWDRYYKVDKVHKRAVLGTGLGLSIVKNILLLHGSRFGVSSEVGNGSTFWFEFKIEKTQDI